MLKKASVNHGSGVMNSNPGVPPSRRAQITEIAARIFADRGYYGARLEDVAKQLDVTRASLYYHVKNKEAILKEICDTVLETALEDSRKIEKSDLSPLEKLRLYIRGKVVSTAEHRELCVVLFEQ
ncbi:MAG: TetR/AcrR family transcriptional regulator, partial [Dehalococcoidia bacterium]|nr:TetR/AcrR family transcriptional regulator [Dehalococcoidia bacterium]